MIVAADVGRAASPRLPATPTREALAALLVPTPVVFAPAVTDRAAWEAFARAAAGASLLRQAEALLHTPMPEGADEMYQALHQDYSPANRARWDQLTKRRRDRVRTLTLAEAMENRGRFLPELERTIASLCAEKAWVFPNYDRDLASYRQTVIQIDLFSSALGWSLATADGLLGERLSAATRQQLRAELERRIFTPFRRMVARQQPPYWLTYRNNWQAVCLAGVTGAALAVLDSPTERAFFVREAMERSWMFLESYTPDGYCSEGVGYWNYGFGHYVLLAGLLHQATAGQIDLLARAPVPAAAAYGFGIELAPGLSPAFADADPVMHPDELLLNFLNRRFGFGQAERKASSTATRHLFADLFYGFYAPRMSAVPAASARAPLTIGVRSWFPDAGILLGRPAAGSAGRLAVALKGGHNAEQHNHNDLGSFVVLVGRRPVLTDPGQEIRSGRTFSARRYESKLTNSYGHPVPVVAGTLQSTGAQARAVTRRTEFTPERDTYVMDLTSAYAVPALRELTRTFVYERTGAGALTVRDEVDFSAAQSFATALVTLGAWERTGPRTLRCTEGGEAVHVEIDTGGEPFVLEAEQIEGPRKTLPATTRLGIRLERPVSHATIQLRIRP